MMTLQSSVKGDDLYVYLSGEMDECSVMKIKDRTDFLLDEHAGLSRAVFNLAGVRFMDSTAIGFLIGRYNRLKRYGVEMRLENPDRNADKLLTLSGIYSIIPKI